MKHPPAELFPERPPEWHVVTPEPHKHQLCYGAKVQSKLTGPNGLSQLRAMAILLNKHGKVPEKAVQCAADAKNPDAYRLSLAENSQLLIQEQNTPS